MVILYIRSVYGFDLMFCLMPNFIQYLCYITVFKDEGIPRYIFFDSLFYSAIHHIQFALLSNGVGC